MRTLIIVVGLLASWMRCAYAETSECPHTIIADLPTNEFQEKNTAAYAKAERQFFVEDKPALATEGMLELLKNGDLNDYETLATLRLIGALHIDSGRYADAATVLERALRIGDTRSIRAQVSAHRVLVQLYRYLGDPDGEARVFKLWKACGGDELALQDWLAECGDDFESLCLNLGSAPTK